MTEIETFEQHPDYVAARERLRRLTQEKETLAAALRDAWNNREDRQNADVQAVMAGLDLPVVTDVAAMQRRHAAIEKALPLASDELNKARRRAADAVIEARRPGHAKHLAAIKKALGPLRAALEAEQEYRDETDRRAGSICAPPFLCGKEPRYVVEAIDRFLRDN